MTSDTTVEKLLSPRDGSEVAMGESTFTWEAYGDVTGYHLMVDDNQDFSSPFVNNDTIDQATTTYNVTGLTAEQTYYWKVIAMNGSGTWQEWSGTWNFYTNRNGEQITETVDKVTETGTIDVSMRYVEAGYYYVGSQTGTYDYVSNSNQTLTNGFWVAETEVTYELWYEVYQWAISNGYTFANAGREGHDGSTGATPTAAKLEPVTYINWRDAMVWCNALSEKEGLDPVYCSNSGFTTPLRSVTNNTSLDTTAGAEDNPYVDWTASGYRLPREVEWEIAARGATPSSNSYGTTYAGSITVEDVAWYWSNSGNSTHEVATKQSNEIGLYDMSGNLYEWCWDWYGNSYPAESSDCDGPDTGSSRVRRGGGWYDSDSNLYCEVGYRLNSNPYTEYGHYGFRPVRTAQ